LPIIAAKFDSLGITVGSYTAHLAIFDTAMHLINEAEYGCVDANCQRIMAVPRVKIDYYNGKVIVGGSASGPATNGSSQNIVLSYQIPSAQGGNITPLHFNVIPDSLTGPVSEKDAGRKNITYKNNKIFFAGHDFYTYFNPFTSYKNTLVVACMDSNLNASWTRHIGGDAYYIPSNILATSDGGCIVLAQRYDSDVPANEYDHYIFKLDANGNLLTVHTLKFQNAIKVFPNPADSYVYFDLNKADDYTVSINDLNGKNVIQKTFKGHETKINIDPLPPGVYNYRILCNQINVYSGLLLKK
jgi:hypothetical protein